MDATQTLLEPPSVTTRTATSVSTSAYTPANTAGNTPANTADNTPANTADSTLDGKVEHVNSLVGGSWSETCPKFVSPVCLQEMLDTNLCAVQIVDCRPFLNYNMERISGSVNVYCPPLVKRRFQSCLPLATMLSPETKLTLCRSTITCVVLHDQCTDEALYHLGQSDLPLVLHSLRHFLGERSYLVLAGGYCRFRQEFPSLCSSHTSLSGQLRHVKRIGSPQHGISTTSATSRRILSLTPVELLPYLYIGDAEHSSRKELLQNFKISAILNVSTSCENHFPSDFRYKVIPVEDSSNANLFQWFEESIAFIESERRSGGKVLVHCRGGISRSATVCLAYLMYSRHLHLEDAFEYVRSRRHVISPNANFMMQLTQFETELRSLGFCWPADSLRHPLSPCRHFTFGSCPDISKFRVAEEEEEEAGRGPVDIIEGDEEEEEDELGEDKPGDGAPAGDLEGDEEEEEDYESSTCSDVTPPGFEQIRSPVGFFTKPLASPS